LGVIIRPMHDKYKCIIDNLIQWSTIADNVKATLIIGSQARKNIVADENSDLDIVVFVDDAESFYSSNDWLSEIGLFHVVFIESTMDGGKEKRVLFDGALDVDIIILPYDIIDALPNVETSIAMIRGYSILVDKIGVAKKLEQFRAIPPVYDLPTEQDFVNIINDFWYHAVWTAKKLKRGELWTSKFCLDSYMKWKLLTIAECHTRITKGIEHDTWYGGRFLEQWAEPWVVHELRSCFALYDEESIKEALYSTMSLFRSLALDITKKLKYQYPSVADEYTTACVAEILS